MKLKTNIHPCFAVLAGAVFYMGLAAGAFAQAPEDRPAPPSREKMEAVRACAEAKGVELPTPRMRGQHEGKGGGMGRGMKSENGEMGQGKPMGPPPEGGEEQRANRPRLSEEQRAIVEACFAEQGITRPHRRGPRPE